MMKDPESRARNLKSDARNEKLREEQDADNGRASSPLGEGVAVEASGGSQTPGRRAKTEDDRLESVGGSRCDVAGGSSEAIEDELT